MTERVRELLERALTHKSGWRTRARLSEIVDTILTMLAAAQVEIFDAAHAERLRAGEQAALRITQHQHCTCTIDTCEHAHAALDALTKYKEVLLLHSSANTPISSAN